MGFDAFALWADADAIVVAGSDGSIALRMAGSSEFERIDGAPAASYGSVWAFSPNDIWAGNSEGQLARYDGSTWKTVRTNAKDTIVKMWGVGGVLYYITASEFGRWNGTQLEVLIPANAGLQMHDVWGRSQNEVFLAVSDARLAQYKCGDTLLVWFDGAQFHQF